MPCEKHNQEWLNSAVSQSIIDLNVVSLNNFEAYDRLLYALPNSDRRNDGRIRSRILRRYQHLELGAWWVSGKDLLTGSDSVWGQLKPDTPYRYQEKSEKGFGCNQYKYKSIKYETPKNVPTEVIALKVSFKDSWNIVKNQNEAVKNAWIERIEKDWKIIINANREIVPEQAKFLDELREACEVRQYEQINRLLQSVSDQPKHNQTQPANSDPRGIKGLSKIEDREFWSWLIQTPKIPLVITEGGKKAGAIIHAGYVGLALPGIFNGYRQPKDEWGNKIGSACLIPQLELLAQNGREMIFCFDRDTKPNTVKNVRTAIAKTGNLFKLQGACVSVITWDTPEKGVDDLIVKRGADYFRSLYKARTNLANFKLQSSLDISKYQPLVVNQRYLSDSLTPATEAQLIGLKSPKNTGKTEWMSRIVRHLINKGKPVLIITHRIQLAKALCARFGVDHIEEVRTSETKGIFGYGLCIDSLHSDSQANFNHEDWSEAVVILDEAEQVIWHLLDSSTCQSNRVEIIENFQKLLKTVISTGGQIYLSDADLSPIALDYVRDLIDVPVKTWVAENVYKPQTKRKLIPYTGNDPRDLIAALVQAIESGEKVLVQTTGQKIKSKWGSTNLESYLKEKFPLSKMLRIDRVSVSEIGHPAFGCMGNLDTIISSYDIVIASPVIETGVSIDLKGHFNSVWAIAQGVQTVDAVCQTVERLREGVPRHIWIKTTAKGNRIGNGSTSVKALLRSQHKLTQANIMLLQQASISDFDDLDANFSPASFIGWAKRACLVNAGKNNYRESILSKLLSEGYELEMYNDKDTEDADIIRQEVYQVCENNYQHYRSEVSTAMKVTEAELEKLNNKKAKTKAERLSEKKGNLKNKYGVEVTPELVKKDDRGWYGQLQLLYYLTVGNRHLAERDKRYLAKFSKDNKAFKPDINKQALSAQIAALKILGIEQFLDSNAEFSKSSLTEFLDRAVQMRFEIKTLLGVTINPEKDSGIAVAQRILKKLGVKLEFKYWRGDRSSKARIYSGSQPLNNEVKGIFDYWLEREVLRSEKREKK